MYNAANTSKMIDNFKTNIFLKKIGFIKDVNHTQLDNRLLKSLDLEDQIKLKKSWENNQLGVGTSIDLYTIPKNLKQACLLFSHDYERIEKSLNWIANEVISTNTKSAIEMGCGFGVLIKFLKKNKPEIELMGIDYAENLINIGQDLTGIKLINASYLEHKPISKYDTIICDFGFDMDNLKFPIRECKIEKIGQIEFCINCCDDFKMKFTPYINAWKMWSNDQSKLVIAGRINSNRNFILAFLELCNEYGWNLDINKIAKIETYDKEYMEGEKFLALCFETKEENKVKENFEKIITLLE